MKSYKERLEIAKNITKNNRMFLMIAAILLVVIITNAVQQGSQKPYTETSTEMMQETESSEIVSEDSKPEELPRWRFYPIDLAILAIGGGFCGIMIIREKKKAREKLQ